jgi:hypothetical protein
MNNVLKYTDIRYTCNRLDHEIKIAVVPRDTLIDSTQACL